MVKIFLAKVESRIKSEIFIRHVANKYMGMQQEELIIGKNEYGKPFLVNLPNVNYNISHTKGLIICAISDGCIGIDVEIIRPFNKRIPERFFTKNEQDYIFSRKENQNMRFFEVWTKKEAYVKWIGKGMAVPFESFDVIDDIRINTIYRDNYAISICSNIIHEQMETYIIK